jgi:DNA-binding NarL/FixJ family response regulator
MKHNIVIVDDHLLIAKALTAIIESFEQYEVLYEVENGQVLKEKFRLPANIPDIVLLDVSMPVMNGFETAAWLKENHPSVSVMALSMQDDDQSLVNMIKNGARGYLHKNVHPADLRKALDTLVSKGFYYPDWAASRILMNIGEVEKKQSIRLNDREMEFLAYACSELTYREIGEKMFVSPRTVESYRDQLFEKLGLKTRVGLVLYAIKIGIIPKN